MVLVFFLCRAALAQQTSNLDSSKALTPEAALNIHFLSDLQLAPDGSRLSFVVSEVPKADKRLQHIWIYDKKSGNARQFTYSAKSETSPRWSPDGKRLAFLSNRGGDEQQIYVMNSGGG
jgi:Tol biopolymer transport system component